MLRAWLLAVTVGGAAAEAVATDAQGNSEPVNPYQQNGDVSQVRCSGCYTTHTTKSALLTAHSRL